MTHIIFGKKEEEDYFNPSLHQGTPTEGLAVCSGLSGDLNGYDSALQKERAQRVNTLSHILQRHQTAAFSSGPMCSSPASDSSLHVAFQISGFKSSSGLSDHTELSQDKQELLTRADFMVMEGSSLFARPSHKGAHTRFSSDLSSRMQFATTPSQIDDRRLSSNPRELKIEITHAENDEFNPPVLRAKLAGVDNRLSSLSITEFLKRYAQHADGLTFCRALSANQPCVSISLPSQLSSNLLEFFKNHPDFSSWNCGNLVVAAYGGYKHRRCDMEKMGGSQQLRCKQLEVTPTRQLTSKLFKNARLEPLSGHKLKTGDIILMLDKKEGHVTLYLADGLCLEKDAYDGPIRIKNIKTYKKVWPDMSIVTFPDSN